MIRRILCASLLLAATGNAGAAGVVDPVVDGNRLTATISLAGEYEAKLVIEFESAVGLTAGNLGLSADLIGDLDLDVVSRLPDPAVSVAAGFPVHLSIDPPADGGFSFAGVASVELYTQNLQFDTAVPLRLVSAENGGAFRDITGRVSGGSYRTRGGKGQFSEFLIVLDARGSNAVAAVKFQRLNDLLGEHQSAMSSGLAADLQALVDDAEAHYQAELYGDAIRDIEAFADVVAQAADSGQLPNVWRSARDLDNVAGLLRAAAATLRFSLTQLANEL